MTRPSGATDTPFASALAAPKRRQRSNVQERGGDRGQRWECQPGASAVPARGQRGSRLAARASRLGPASQALAPLASGWQARANRFVRSSGRVPRPLPCHLPPFRGGQRVGKVPGRRWGEVSPSPGGPARARRRRPPRAERLGRSTRAIDSRQRPSPMQTGSRGRITPPTEVPTPQATRGRPPRCRRGSASQALAGRRAAPPRVRGGARGRGQETTPRR